MAITETFDVAIVGYGPTGATLANLLAGLDLKIVVIDREEAIYDLPRAVHFDDEVMRVFQTVGISEPLTRKTHVNPGMRFVDCEGNLLLDWPRPQETTTHGWHASYRLHQPDLEVLLRDRLADYEQVTIRTGHEVTGVSETDADVALTCRTRTTGETTIINARYAVGCDGANSTIRNSIDRTMTDFGFCERWLVVDMLLKRERPELGDHSIQYCDSDRPMTYCRSPANRRRWEITVKDGESDAEISSPDRVWELLSRWVTPDDAELERSAVYTFRSALAKTWHKGRLLIAGDAAHLTPPFMGQGMCTGIRDAANLGWKLASVLGGADPALLNTYQAERAPHAQSYIETAIRLGGLINSLDRAGAMKLTEGSSGVGNSMKSIQPKLGSSSYLRVDPTPDNPVGRPFPQVVLNTGERLDDRIGYHSALVTTQPCNNTDLPNLTILSASEHPELSGVLSDFGAGAILIGPDRYVRGIGGDAAALMKKFTPILKTNYESLVRK